MSDTVVSVAFFVLLGSSTGSQDEFEEAIGGSDAGGEGEPVSEEESVRKRIEFGAGAEES